MDLQKNKDYLEAQWKRESRCDRFLVCLNRSKVKELAKAFPDWIIYMYYEIVDLLKVADKHGLVEAVHNIKKTWQYSVIMGIEQYKQVCLDN